MDFCRLTCSKRLFSVPPIRRESFNVEHSVQMDYMYHTSWNWCTPTKDSTILYAVLRRRLQEGFLITNAHNGYITVTVQLGMQVCKLARVFSPQLSPSLPPSPPSSSMVYLQL